MFRTSLMLSFFLCMGAMAQMPPQVVGLPIPPQPLGHNPILGMPMMSHKPVLGMPLFKGHSVGLPPGVLGMPVAEVQPRIVGLFVPHNVKPNYELNCTLPADREGQIKTLRLLLQRLSASETPVQEVNVKGKVVFEDGSQKRIEGNATGKVNSSSVELNFSNQDQIRVESNGEGKLSGLVEMDGKKDLDALSCEIVPLLLRTF